MTIKFTHVGNITVNTIADEDILLHIDDNSGAWLMEASIPQRHKHAYCKMPLGPAHEADTFRSSRPAIDTVSRQCFSIQTKYYQDTRQVSEGLQPR